MKLLRGFPQMAFLLMLLSITGYCLAQRSFVLLIVAGTIAVVSWFVTEGPRGRTIPPVLSHILVLAVSVFVILDWYQHQTDWLGVLGRYAVWLTLIKLYETKTPRDYAQLLSFSLLLMVTGCLLSADILFSIVLLVYAILGLYVLLLFQLHNAFEGERTRRNKAAPKGYRLAPMLKPVFGSSVGADFRILAITLGVIGFVLSIFFFLIFPRGQGEDVLPGLPVVKKRVTAFFDRVNLGAGSRITESRRPVMRVAITNPDGTPLLDAPYLLRGGVLDVYEGKGRWRPMKPDFVTIGTDSDEYVILSDDILLQPTRVLQKFKLDLPLDVLPSLGTPQAVKISSSLPLFYDPITQLIHKPSHVGRLMTFEVVAEPNPTLETRRSLLRGRSLRWNAKRFRSPQVRQLARQLIVDRGIDLVRPADPREAWSWNRQVAAIFNDYLHSDVFTYTLDLSDVVIGEEGSDPIEQFLFETKRGHCEYFAAGLVALCHTVNIQGRLVTGFVAYEYDESAQEYIISESNAHAWAEVRTGPVNWTTFDPTPPALMSSLHNTQPTLPDRLDRLLSNLESGFIGGILNFNQRDQEDMIKLMDLGWSERLGVIWDQTRQGLKSVNAYFQLGPAGYIWMGIVALALTIAVIALVKLMRRSLALRRTLHLQHLSGGEYQLMLRQLGFYLDMLYVLRRGGHEKPNWQPPAQFAESLALTRPDAASCVRFITDLFYASRYGRRGLEKSERLAVRAQLEKLAGLLKVRL